MVHEVEAPACRSGIRSLTRLTGAYSSLASSQVTIYPVALLSTMLRHTSAHACTLLAFCNTSDLLCLCCLRILIRAFSLSEVSSGGHLCHAGCCLITNKAFIPGSILIVAVPIWSRIYYKCVAFLSYVAMLLHFPSKVASCYCM